MIEVYVENKLFTYISNPDDYPALVAQMISEDHADSANAVSMHTDDVDSYYRQLVKIRVQQKIATDVASYPSILGTTADAVQLLAVQNMILLKAIAASSNSSFKTNVVANINDMAGSETAFDEYAGAADAFLVKVKNKEILLPYLVKGGVNEVLEDVAERATGVAQILISAAQEGAE